MKQLLGLLFLACIGLSGNGQMRKTDTIFICHDKTTTLLFPSRIVHVDRGTPEVLIQTVRARENVLLVKAGSEGFRETNLSVLTEEGSAYCFILLYQNKPLEFIREVGRMPPSIPLLAEGLVLYPALFHKGHPSTQKPYLQVQGIYYKWGHLFLRVAIRNETGLDYLVENFRLSVHSRARGKRTPRQQKVIDASYIAAKPDIVVAGGQAISVIALRQVRLSPGQYLSIEVNGVEHLRCRVRRSWMAKGLSF